MGTDERAAAGFVIQQLLDHPQAFNLFQAISLLETESARAEHGVVGEPVCLRSHVSLAFEPSDIKRVEVRSTTDSAYTLWTSVLGLAGSGGPLPAVFTEMLLARAAKRDHAMAEFLDIFNQRFLHFLYEARRKSHAALGTKPLQSVAASVLDAVGSLGLSRPMPIRAPLWLRHAGLLSGAPRSMTGLLALLRDRLDLRIEGRQFVGQWLSVEAESMGSLNRSCALNGTAVLGRRVWDQAAGIALEIAVDSAEDLNRCLPGGSTYQHLQALIRAYVRQELSVILVLLPCRKFTTQPRLQTQTGMRLGWTSWLPRRHTAPPAEVRLKLALHDF